MEKVLKIFIVLIGFLILVNLLFLDFVWISGQKKSSEEKLQIPILKSEPTIIQTSTNVDCSSCQKLIKEEVAKAIPSEELKPTPTKKVTPTPPQTKISYITIGSSGSTSETSWIDIAGTDFYFNLADYQTVENVRFEVSLRSFLAGNEVYVQLYDITNKRVVDNSGLSTSSGTSILLRSSDLTIWQGNNLYRVQAKSSSGNPLYLDTPRLKITYR